MGKLVATICEIYQKYPYTNFTGKKIWEICGKLSKFAKSFAKFAKFLLNFENFCYHFYPLNPYKNQ